jgi:tripartite-type tricarboxylate transporter receptor subunit TctC
VPYKGGAPITNDLLAGQIDLGVMTLPGGDDACARRQAGAMLGVLSSKRAAAAPDMPTINESAGSSRAWRSRSGPPWPARPGCRRRWSTA